MTIALSLGIFVEPPDGVGVRCADDGIAADADTSGLPDARTA